MFQSEGEDQYTITIKVTEPSKVGDGMGAYMTYRVITKVGTVHHQSDRTFKSGRWYGGIHDL